MSEVKKIATRESYGNALVELGKAHEDVVVLDADLAAATKTGRQRQKRQCQDGKARSAYCCILYTQHIC